MDKFLKITKKYNNIIFLIIILIVYALNDVIFKDFILALTIMYMVTYEGFNYINKKK